MATIELYKSKINNMSNYINQAKSAVGDFCVDLSALKSKVLGINSSVCDSVVTSISTSSQTQEQQIAGLEATQREVDEFINLTVIVITLLLLKYLVPRRTFTNNTLILNLTARRLTGKSSAKA